MQMLFVDESGTAPRPDQADAMPLFVLGGIVIPEDCWSKLASDLNRLKAHYGIAGEIKWRDFAPERPGNNPSPLSKLSPQLKDDLRMRIYNAIRGYKPIRVIAVVTHAPTAYQSDYIHTADDLYWYSYKQLTERFQYHLQDLERTVGQRVNGIVVCDHRGPKDDKRLRELHFNLLAGNKTTSSRYENLIEGLFIAPSHLSVGIQLADLVAGAIYRYFKSDDARFYREIEPLFRRSKEGVIEGYGLVRFPKSGW